ncbi:Hypothetical predicted protein [Olea europaea subsp. europaea]|uniref:TOD1/MUCI70 glycosyltransferase-like domain-containing protein n=1 Tax=Olea europaea subsp. europaea TaxID=158383 RepID=A0A8S0S0F4_OLEEU|nr:Hypothetical predicted protein [Olea europaea subsp. europaea]
MLQVLLGGNASFAISRHHKRFDVFVDVEANKANGKRSFFLKKKRLREKTDRGSYQAPKVQSFHPSSLPTDMNSKPGQRITISIEALPFSVAFPPERKEVWIKAKSDTGKTERNCYLQPKYSEL